MTRFGTLARTTALAGLTALLAISGANAEQEAERFDPDGRAEAQPTNPANVGSDPSEAERFDPDERGVGGAGEAAEDVEADRFSPEKRAEAETTGGAVGDPMAAERMDPEVR